jgi:hypothetical protein
VAHVFQKNSELLTVMNSAKINARRGALMATIPLGYLIVLRVIKPSFACYVFEKP